MQTPADESELSDLSAPVYVGKERIARLRRENHLLRQELLRLQRARAQQTAPDATATAPSATLATSSSGAVSAQEEALKLRIQTLERKNTREKARRTATEREYRYEIELLRLALDEAARGSPTARNGAGGGGTGTGMSRPSSPQTAFPPGGFHGRTTSMGESWAPTPASPSHPSASRHTGTGTTRGAADAAAEETPGERLQKLFEARVAEHEQATNPWATDADALFRQAAARREQRRVRLRGIATDGDDDGEGSPLPGAVVSGGVACGDTASANSTTRDSSIIGDDVMARGGGGGATSSGVIPGAERFQTEPILLTPNADDLKPSRRVSKLAASMRGLAPDSQLPTPNRGQHADPTAAAAAFTSGRRGRARRGTQAENDAEMEMLEAATGKVTGPVVNPNQIGVELSDDERTRSWYLKEALSVVLQQVVHRRANPESAAPPAQTTPLPAASRPPTGTHAASSSSGSDTDPYGDYHAAKNSQSQAKTGSPQPAPAATDTVHTDDRGRVLVYRDVNPIALQRAIADTLHFHVHCVSNNPVLCKPHQARTLRLGSFASENTDPNLRAAFSPEHMSEDVKAVQRAGTETDSHASRKARKDEKSHQSHSGEYRDDELEVTVHAPIIFTQVRSFVGLDLDRFCASLEMSTWRQSMSPGKSGTTLLYFGDCVMKTMKDSEFEFLMQRYLPLYVPYCERYPHSLLPQIYGVISVQWLKLGVTRRFFLMQNVFGTQYYIHRIYDVKGSTVNRTALKPGQPAPRTPFGALMLKDNDLPPQLIICGEHQRAILVAQLRSDVHFLQSLNIVDYSCMIGVRSRIFTREEGPSRTVLLRRQGAGGQAVDVGATVASGNLALDDPNNSGATLTAASPTDNAEDDLFVCIRGCDGGLLSLPVYSPGDDTTAREDVYYIGIIDVLQEYNKTKKFENFAKGFVNDRTQISVIPPKEYAERLCRVIERISV